MRQSIINAPSKVPIKLGKHPSSNLKTKTNREKSPPRQQQAAMSDFDQLRHDALAAQDRVANITADGAPKNYPKL